MKKFLRVLLIMLMLSFAFVIQPAKAEYNGKWINPYKIKVFIPKDRKYTDTVRAAFDEWSVKTNGKIGFKDEQYEFAQIRVKFTDVIPKKTGGYTSYALTLSKKYITKSRVIIIPICAERSKYKHGLKARTYSQTQSDKCEVYENEAYIRKIALQEIGRAIGLGNPKEEDYCKSIMGGASEITNYDIEMLKELYNWR